MTKKPKKLTSVKLTSITMFYEKNKKPCAHNPRVVQGGCAEGCAGGLCRVIFGGVLEVFNTVS